jgi:uncharacterized membrane protein YbhN (UPF0104 family)
MLAQLRRYIWPIIGAIAVIFSARLLYKEVRNLALDDVILSLEAIPAQRWALAIACNFLAYAALAGYDRVALLHLGKRVPWPFVALTSFTTYALSHNIGASMLSGAVVRYRAYTTKGLTPAEIGVLVALSSFTFFLGSLITGGVLLLIEPGQIRRFVDLPNEAAVILGVAMLAAVVLYILGSLLHLRPLTLWGFHVYYPRPQVVVWQLALAPVELMGAAGIIYFSLPAAGNPGFLAVLGVFLVSFTVALISHAPGGLGVLEYVFLVAFEDLNKADVLAALIVFRVFYLLVPLALALVVVPLFERSQLTRSRAPPP